METKIKRTKNSLICTSTYNWKTVLLCIHMKYILYCITFGWYFVFWECVKCGQMQFWQTVSLFHYKRLSFKSHTKRLFPFTVNVLLFGSFLLFCFDSYFTRFLFVPWTYLKIIYSVISFLNFLLTLFLQSMPFLFSIFSVGSFRFCSGWHQVLDDCPWQFIWYHHCHIRTLPDV